jgi:hypothetical protein
MRDLQCEEVRRKSGDNKDNKLLASYVFPYQVPYPCVVVDVFGNTLGMIYNLLYPI